MRASLLACCFALLITLAVVTVSLRANNRAMRRSMADLQGMEIALRVELARLQFLALERETPEKLAARLWEAMAIAWDQ